MAESSILPGSVAYVEQRSRPSEKGFTQNRFDLGGSSTSLFLRRLKPVILLLRVFRLFHSHRWVESGEETTTSGWNVSKVYSLVVVGMTWLNVARYFAGYDVSDFKQITADVALRLFFHVWFLTVAVNTTVLFQICNNPTKLKRLCSSWQQQCEEVSASFEKELRIAFAVPLLLVVANSSCYLVSMFGGSELFVAYGGTIAPFDRRMPVGYDVPIKLLFFVTGTYQSAAYMIPFGFFYIVSKMFQCELQSFNDKVRHVLRPDGGHNCASMLLLREEFLRNCDYFSILDDVFRYFLGFSLLLMIVMGCLLTFVISSLGFGTVSVVRVTVICVWVGSLMLKSTALSHAAGGVHDEIYDCKPTLLKIRNLNRSEGQDVQLMLWLEKLRENSMKYTAFGFFAVDRKSIITMTGLMISYAILIWEVNKDSASSSSNGCFSDHSCSLASLLNGTNATELSRLLRLT